MVFYIGITPSIGKCVAYNEETEEPIEYEITGVNYWEIKKINKMFEEIKEKINGAEIGCVCVCLEWSFDNEIRKKFLESAKVHGITKIELIDEYNLLLLQFILRLVLVYEPQNDDLIWIMEKEENYAYNQNGELIEKCYLWEKRNGKLKINKLLNKISVTTVDDLPRIKTDLGFEKNPKIIIFVSYDGIEIKSDSIRKIFPGCEIKFYTKCYDFTKIAMLKARVIARDLKLQAYNIYSHHANTFSVGINDKKIIDFDNFHPMPTEKSVIIPIKSNEKTLKISFRSSLYYLHTARKVVKNTISFILREPMPIFNNDNRIVFYEGLIVTPEMIEIGEILFTFKIGENRICSFDYCLNKTVENVEKCLIHLYLQKEVKDNNPSYDIPQKIKTNDDNINAVGIDLGTTRCCAAVNRRNGIETVAIDSSERQMPSYIAFDEAKEKCGKLVMNRLQNYSKSTIFDSKRIIGRNFNLIKMDETWPFKIINLDNKPQLRVKGPGKFLLEKHPEEVAAVLLKHIKQKVEEFQGKKLDEVVITVPAAFTNEQKLATHVAGILAGWKTITLLPEPVAASIAYFIDRPIPQNENILLFDLGGGTLDVCIFKISNNKPQIIANAGNTHLGGRDFDQLLINHFQAILLKDYKINVNSKDKSKYKLMEKCMEIKHTLSAETKASLDVSDFKLDVEVILNITLHEFVAMSTELLEKVKECIKKSLLEAKLDQNQINKVLIVGGACRMPMIKKLLKDTFAQAEQCCEENLDEVVAIGAAYYAYYLNFNDSRGVCSII